MKFIKVSFNSALNVNIIDYKGLDINLFIAGSQLYPNDVSWCAVATTEDLTNFSHPDVEIITEEEYLELKAEIDNEKAVLAAEEAAKKDTMQSDIDTLMLAVAELYEGGTV